MPRPIVLLPSFIFVPVPLRGLASLAWVKMPVTMPLEMAEAVLKPPFSRSPFTVVFTITGPRLPFKKVFTSLPFTPPPDGNLPLDEAREAWQGKAVWINFPSSVHLAEPERIREVTRELVRQGAAQPGFAVSVTENIPASVGTRSLEAIAEALGTGQGIWLG